MTLRTRLILAFLVMSVGPLTVVTFYSYLSSRQALRHAAQMESTRLTTEMTQRMEFVTADLGRRVDRLWDVPMAATAGEGAGVEAPGLADQVAPMLGEAAAMLERLEIIPMHPEPRRAVIGAPPDGPPPPPRPPGHPAAGRERVVIHMPKVLEKARADNQTAEAALEAMIERVIEGGLDMGRRGVAIGLRATAEAIARHAEQVAVAAQRKASLAGRELEIPIERDGRMVGKVQARLDLEQVLATVMSSHREQGEIPFALDGEQRLYTARPADRERLRAILPAEGLPSGRARAGDWIIVSRQDTSGLTFGIARPVADSLRELRRASARNLAMGLLIIGLAFAGVVPLARRMTRHVSALDDGVREIARGNYAARVPVRSKDEFGKLAEAFNQMAKDVEAHQKLLVEQERLQRELELCRQIQTEMLPKTALRLGLAEVKGVSIPAREVGGDFFNYFMLPDGQLAMLVGDVSGKGVGAALLMANIQATLQARLPVEPELTRLFDTLDREIEQTTPRGVYSTLFIGVLDPARQTLRYVNAGHNPQFVLRAGGGLERMASTGMPVGLFAGKGYRERAISLAEGDLIFFYTDGLVETENAAGEMFGAERLEALLLTEHEKRVADLLARVEATLREFRGVAEPFDDATMMALRLDLPPEPSSA
jgi:serine phosphatase RsbU (regulator of sigma subunit)